MFHGPNLKRTRVVSFSPVCTVDESLWDPAECAVVVQAGAADVANVYIAESGGILKASTNLAMCEAAGITGLIGAAKRCACCFHRK